MVDVIVVFRDAVFSALMAWGGVSAEPETPIKDREPVSRNMPASGVETPSADRPHGRDASGKVY
jgi:hypothetical protein